MRVTLEGQARAGDVIRAPWGVYLEVVSIVSAGDLVEAIAEQAIAMRAPNFMRNSIAATCALYGATVGREKRNRVLERKRLERPVRAVKGAA